LQYFSLITEILSREKGDLIMYRLCLLLVISLSAVGLFSQSVSSQSRSKAPKIKKNTSIRVPGDAKSQVDFAGDTEAVPVANFSPSAVFANSASITINDRISTIGAATPYPSSIVVSGLGNITAMNVKLSNINHTFPDDVDVLLVGPAGQKYILMSDVGGNFVLNNVTLTFSDSGTALPDSAQIASGTVRPTNIGATDTFPAPAPAGPYNNPPTAGAATFASVFGGQSANGTWSLYVGDDAAGDVGIISDGWTLNLTTDAGSGSFSNTNAIRINDSFGRATPYPSSINVTGLTGTITDVNVTLTNMNHTFPQDIAVLLVGPKGQNIILMSQAVGDDLTPLLNTTLTFDDSAATLLPTTGGAASGSYRPATYSIVDFPAPAPTSPPNYPTLGGTATLATAFNGTNPNGTWSLYVVDVAPPDPGNINGGWSLDITAGGTARRFTRNDFDGDGRSDISIWSPTTGNWDIRNSSTFKYRTVLNFGSGGAGDIIVPNDYDGDGITDLAYFRPSAGSWTISQSSTGTTVVKTLGIAGDVPVPADYDGDGKVDIAVFRPSLGNWSITQSTTNTTVSQTFGTSTDTPTPGDYDGDGKSDLAFYHPADGNWSIKNSSDGTTSVFNLATTGDQLVPADYDGDLKTDIAIWRISDGNWAIRNSSTGTVVNTVWGPNDNLAVPADYDGDGKADLAVYDPSGLTPPPTPARQPPAPPAPAANWNILQSSISGISPSNRYDTLIPSAPTAARVTVGGRAITTGGRGLANVRITMTDATGNVRTMTTSSFGYYRFTDVAAGETYVFSASAKRYTFVQQSCVLNIDEDTDGVNFIGD
jgi:subtilisin-like proprotein convertase family protein